MHAQRDSGSFRGVALLTVVTLAACNLYANTDYVPGAEEGNVDTTAAIDNTPDDTGALDTGGLPVETGGAEGGGEFAFDDAPAADFSVQIDRLGMPAVGTAVITDKAGYNAATPEDDAAGTFVEEITANVTAIHEALDDDLEDLDLVPCEPDDCVTQAAPLVVPDTLKLDLTVAAGFPNGRLLTDPVMDVTLAVVLLDLTEDGQTPTSLVGVLNPDENDVDFLDDFPYLAEPN